MQRLSRAATACLAATSVGARFEAAINAVELNDADAGL
jgi:hypothetical protein